MAAKKKESDKVMPSDIDFTEDLGAGFENVDQSDLGIPFLSIIQQMSPELNEESPKFLEEAKAGHIVLSTNKTIYGGKTEAALFVPCGYQKAYVEWQPGKARCR